MNNRSSFASGSPFARGCLATGWSIWLSLSTLGAAEPISFNRDVRPILADRCYHCHGPDAENQDSEFRLDSAANATADLGGYAGVVPGDLAASELHTRIHADDGSIMPPSDSNRVLSAAEIDILDRWIEQGAEYEDHWAFKPVPDVVPVPSPDDPAGWVRGDIDRFILRGIRAAGLTTGQQLSREKWLRRVTFDLTGLPPTTDQIDAFLADRSSDAAGQVVDRLLSSPASAERLTTEWLDVARYADSFGYQRDDPRYVWPWRDWVIDSFQQNKPYDEFIIEQLAGDLLPGATRNQQLATTFNRLHSHNKEGGVAVEEFRVEYVSDRVHTLAGAFMGLTMECARCHDHKFDPIKTKEYYQLTAFFSGVAENGLISYFTDATPTPSMGLPTEPQQHAIDRATAEVTQAQKHLQESISRAETAFDPWSRGIESISDLGELAADGWVAAISFDQPATIDAAKLRDEENKKLSAANVHAFVNEADADQPTFTSVNNKLAPGRFGNAIALTGDDAVIVPGVGHFERHDPFSFSLWIHTPELTERGVIYRRSRGWDDAGSIGYELTKEGDRLVAKLSHFWPGNAIGIQTTAPLVPNRWTHVAVTYDGCSRAEGLRIYTDGRLAATAVLQDRLTRSITDWRGGYEDLAIGSRYRDRGFKDGRVDQFLVYDRTLSALEVAFLHDIDDAAGALRDEGQWTSRGRQMLREHYLLTAAPQVDEARQTLRSARKQLNKALDQTNDIMVMREDPRPRRNFVLQRGVYDSHGEEVFADTPAFLPPFPSDQPRNRLGLARWLTSNDHPLTARVTVNRYWQLMFGQGLVRTPEDFGNQSQPPSHPELLDWLARDFIDHGWNLHRLLRMIALSATYGQDSVVDRAKREKDPDNLWLARGPSQRLSAEMIRDNALAVSGLLVDDVGGPPVNPYDVALAYTPLPVDKGDRLYRRSLYTFWRRTSPAPMMITMDANKREVCRLRREITSSPLQAMVMLNSPQFIEAARVMAAGLIDRPAGVDPLPVQAFRTLTSRTPSDQEREILIQLYEEQWEHFRSRPAQAEQLLGVGNVANPPGVDSARLAAATVVINSIMNLDESIRNR